MLTSRVTARAQTTLPSGVRKALGIGPGDQLEYVVEGDQAIIRKAEAEDEHDPALGPFLDLIERDMALHPERLVPVTEALRARIRELTAGIEVDLDEPIEGPVAL